MQSYQSIFDALFAPIMLLCTGQALNCIVLLLRKKDKPYANYLLCLWCLVWGFSCYFFFGYIMGPSYLPKSMGAFLGPAIPISLFPPLYLYSRYFLYDLQKFQWKDLLHFLPLVVYFLFTGFFYFYEGSLAAMRHTLAYHIRSLMVSYIASVQGLLYFYLVARLLKKQNEKVKQEYSNLEKIKLDWLKNLNYLTLPVVAFGSISTAIKSTSYNPYSLFMLYHIFMGIALYYIYFQIILRPSMFMGEMRHISLNENSLNENSSEKSLFNENLVNENALLEDKQISVNQEMIDRLKQFMETKKPYINQDLSLQDLASMLQISRNQLSYILNHELGQKFYDYIHSLRLEECKKRLSDKQYAHYSIIAIAYDSGFNSKTVFYRIFKESVKMSPSKYRSEINKTLL